MTPPYFREAGAGPSVVCLHSSASSSGQWRSLMDRLGGRYRIIAADLYGCGKTPAWPHKEMQLDDEVALLEPVLQAAGPRFHLVGHSLGGAIALKAALRHPDRLQSLVLIEPALFSILMADAPQSAAARDIFALHTDTMRLVDEGKPDAAAERFVDYWMGQGAWRALPEARRTVLAATVTAVRPESHALFADPTPLSAFGTIMAPTLFITGTHSKPSARAVARLLTGVLPRVRVAEIDDVGHMAPVTHPETINPLIERFLDEVA